MAGKKIVNFVQTSDGIERELFAMIDRGKNIQSFLNRVTFAQYKKAQIERWKSLNSTEGTTWPAIKSKAYQDFKERVVINSMTPRKKKTASKRNGARPQDLMTPTGLEAQGKVLMVLTGRLADAATGRGPGLLKVVTNSSITVSLDDSALPYGKYAAAKRPIMRFGAATEGQMIDDVIKYLMTGAGDE